MGWETPREWLAHEREKLRDFNNKWVAVSADGPVAYDRSVAVVFAQLEEREIPISQVGFTYVTFDPWQ